MDGQLLTAYLIAITLLTLTPGVDTALVIRNSARGGWQDGLVSSLGICSGLFMHATISAVGISIILVQTAWLFSLLKLAGAGYLIWLGICNWRSLLNRNKEQYSNIPTPNKSTFRIFRSFNEGFLSNVLNPKTAVFYMAFLPQFITPSESALYQSLLLAGIHFIIAMIWQSLLALTVDRAKAWLEKPKVDHALNGITGSIMIFLGFHLAVKS